MKLSEYQAFLTLAYMARNIGWSFKTCAEKAREAMPIAIQEFPEAFEIPEHRPLPKEASAQESELLPIENLGTERVIVKDVKWRKEGEVSNGKNSKKGKTKKDEEITMS